MQGDKINLTHFEKDKLDKIIKENLEFSFNIYSSINSIEFFKKTIVYLITNKYSFENRQIIINLDIRDKYLNKEQLVDLKKCENLINFEKGRLFINDGNKDLWNIDNIIYANNKLDYVVNTITSLRIPDENNRSLNDIEKLMFAHVICSQITYNENNEEKTKARTITSILNECKSIVCVGYSALFLELCNRLGIKCYSHFCQVLDSKGNQEKHVNNVVVLGKKIFYNDVCWDSVKVGDKLNKLNFFMLPYQDKNNLNYNIKTEESFDSKESPYVNIIKDKKKLELISLIPQNEPIPELNKKQVSSIWLKYSGEFKDLDYFDETYDDEIIRRESAHLLDRLKEFSLDYSIPIELLEKTIYNLNRANGMSKSQAEILTKQIIKFNTANTIEIFKPYAINAFNQTCQNQKETNLS